MVKRVQTQEHAKNEIQKMRFNLEDPSQMDRFPSPNYDDYYANRVELTIGAEDVRITFVHILGAKGTKLQCREQCSVTMSFQQLRRIRDMLVKNVNEDDPRFRPSEIKSE